MAVLSRFKGWRGTRLVYFTWIAATLAACGGGGGTGEPGGTPSSVPSISGSVAAGLPLTGTVTVKDAKGQSRTAPIGLNGQYTVDVNGLTAPFVFRAEGTAGGTIYVIHSAATAADVGGTINITPLTDLVLANVAGQIAANYFNSGDVGQLSQSELNAEAAKLKEKLLPLLQAVGVEGSIDLLRTPFTPLASGLDTVLDQIRVSTEPGGHIATITNIITQQSIQDDLSVKAAAEASPALLDDTRNVSNAGEDTARIRLTLSTFSDHFATGMPAPGVLAPSLTDDFLNADLDKAEFLAQIVTETNLVGAKFTNMVVESIDYGSAIPLAHVMFDVIGAKGEVLDRGLEMRLRKVGGTWRLAGDGRTFDINGHVLLFSGIYHQGSIENHCKGSGMEFWIQDMNEANNGGDIAYMLVKGPGLPAGGLRYNRPQQGGNWRLPSSGPEGGAAGGNLYQMTGTCETLVLPDATIAALPDNPRYTVSAYTAGNAKVALGDAASGDYVVQVPAKRPATLAELQALSFPVMTSPAGITGVMAYVGGDLQMAGSGANPQHSAWSYVFQSTVQGQANSAERDVLPDASGSFSTTLGLPALAAGDAVRSTTVRISTHDSFNRTLVVAIDYFR